MTTENTHSEHNDWQVPGAEQLSVSENSASPAVESASQVEEPALIAEESLPEAATDDELPRPAVEQEGAFPISIPSEQEASLAQEVPFVSIDFPFAITDLPFDKPSATTEVEQAETVVFTTENQNSQPQNQDDVVRPFTDFIEEFRQTEVRLNALLQEPETPFVSFVSETENFAQPTLSNFAHFTELVSEIEQTETPAETSHASEPPATPVSEENTPVLTQPSLSTERPVSPLLRPATRIRLPRHGRHRIEELIQPIELTTETAKNVGEVPAVAEEQPEAEKPEVEEQPARPARRYRFDRPASASTTAAKPAVTPAPARVAETKEKKHSTFATHSESVLSAEVASARPATNGATVPETSAAPSEKVVTPEATPAPTSVETHAPTERRRRGNHERQREKEPVAPVVVPVPVEIVVPEPEPAPAIAEIALEDLPPLEYAELQAANSRRRRRRRAGTASTPPMPISNSHAVSVSKIAPPEISAPAPVPPTQISAVALPKSSPAVPVIPPAAANANANYNIVSGYTVSQMNQGNEFSGPFMGPEPSPARGSTFNTSAQIRPVRSEALRPSTTTHTAKHVGEPTMSPAAVNHLGNVVSQAIQTQTDRMVAELRRANQVPTNISVSLPPFPSNERVGVFVDVANLLYSARTLRMTVDFGKLLDFLRGNRRLVRAQAYCPTSPQPGDDQMFLQAVKGLGYRITTKNYKTFSSGAKKADLDLDLCMDVVRLVDGKAVDCIVLVSGDSDFMPMLDYCSDHGVRVEVAAFDESMSATLRQSCDLFVNLSMLEEIRA